VIPADIIDNDPDVEASRALRPAFFKAPHPDGHLPKQYQHAGVEYAIQRTNRIIGDAPGVGKTAQGIFLSNTLRANRTLVVCPASLRLNWEREIWRWSTVDNVSTYPVMKAADGISTEADYTIISYDLLRNPAIFDAIMDLRWDHLILDEAHAIKDPKGNQRTRVICAPDALPSVVGSTTLLSGTLLPNQPIECYNAIRLCNWDAIGRASLEDFRNFYYAEGGGWVRINGELKYSKKVRNVPRNLEDLQYRLRKYLMVRRLKDDVLPELPPKQWRPFPLALTGAIRQALAHPGWSAAEKLYDMNPGAFNTSIPIDDAISTARMMLGLAKVDATVDYIEDLLESGVEKVVVGGWHTQVLGIMKDKLSKYGLVYMDGRTSDAAKQRAVDGFQQDPKVRVILGQMLPLGEGWTLTAAKDVVIAEPFWVPGKNEQLADRCHRLGQKDNVQVHIPVVPGTLDERILGSTIEKDKNIYKALDAR